MSKPKHSWINYPSKSKRKCTRCGLVKETNHRGIYGVVYYMHGERLDENPGCKQTKL